MSLSVFIARRSAPIATRSTSIWSRMLCTAHEGRMRTDTTERNRHPCEKHTKKKKMRPPPTAYNRSRRPARTRRSTNDAVAHIKIGKLKGIDHPRFQIMRAVVFFVWGGFGGCVKRPGETEQDWDLSECSQRSMRYLLRTIIDTNSSGNVKNEHPKRPHSTVMTQGTKDRLATSCCDQRERERERERARARWDRGVFR